MLDSKRFAIIQFIGRVFAITNTLMAKSVNPIIVILWDRCLNLSRDRLVTSIPSEREHLLNRKLQPLVSLHDTIEI